MVSYTGVGGRDLYEESPASCTYATVNSGHPIFSDLDIGVVERSADQRSDRDIEKNIETLE